MVGIGGNHDYFGMEEELQEFKNEDDIYYFDKGTNYIDGIKVSGISGIIGNPLKVNRISIEEYLEALDSILLDKPDMLLLHQTPEISNCNLKGNAEIGELLQQRNSTLAFCGHIHWDEALIELDNGTQILNIDKRVFILMNREK